MPIFEPGLEQMTANSRRTGQLIFGSTEEAIDWGQAIFICVGTPPLANGDADLFCIDSVARAIASRVKRYRVVVEKSTVPVQTCSQIRKQVTVRGAGSYCDVVSNPEFLREGSAIEDFLHPDRIIVGVHTPRAEEILREIYKPILEQTFQCPTHLNCTHRQVPFVVTDTSSAELIKHASNSFLAMKISFINLIADLCEIVGADVTKVAEGMGLDPRIGPTFLRPGIGFGGFCFPKDLQAFIRIAERSGCDFNLLKEVEKVNKSRVELFIEKIRRELWVLRGKKVAVWGLAFKPNTDDVRFSPALALLQRLVDEGVCVRAYDPQASEKAQAVVKQVTYCADQYEAAHNADALLIATEWEDFRWVDWDRLRSIMDRPLIIDGRNMWDPKEIASRGFDYVSVGRPASVACQSLAAKAIGSSGGLAEISREKLTA
jgi:UDPglucose 6-dehydrogenase